MCALRTFHMVRGVHTAVFVTGLIDQLCGIPLPYILLLLDNTAHDQTLLLLIFCIIIIIIITNQN